MLKLHQNSLLLQNIYVLSSAQKLNLISLLFLKGQPFI